MTYFEVAALPAREGDCLVISYGPNETDAAHIIVDTGRLATAKELRSFLDEKGVSKVELLVISHVDADHIEGVLTFLDQTKGSIEIEDIWFNGWRHLREDLEGLGPEQGEALTGLLAKRPWNVMTEGRAVCTLDDGMPSELPALAGGMKMTVISPDRKKLAAMVKTWERDCADAGLVPGSPAKIVEHSHGLEAQGAEDLQTLADRKSGKDTGKANGTSIALLAEYGGLRVLLGADAHSDILIRNLRALGGGSMVPLDLLKVPHHGSQNNVTRELLETIDCNNFLISTDGSRFNHPDEVAIARIILSRTDTVHLHFNYQQEQTDLWRERAAADERFECHFPEAAGQPIVVDVTSLNA